MTFFLIILDMSWNSGDFFDPSANQHPYNKTVFYDYTPSQSYNHYSNGNFISSSYDINPQIQHTNQFYHPNDYISSYSQSNEDTEPPLLEELGINFDHIFKKTKTILNPFTTPDFSILDDVDLAGPLVFCLLFASSLLLLGKIHFGYVYGIICLGTFGMYTLLNLMSSFNKQCSGLFVTSVLGYCLLPMVILSFLSFLFNLHSFYWYNNNINIYFLVFNISIKIIFNIIINDWTTISCCISMFFILWYFCFINNVLKIRRRKRKDNV